MSYNHDLYLTTLEPTFSCGRGKCKCKHFLLYGTLFLVCAAAIIMLFFSMKKANAAASSVLCEAQKMEAMQDSEELSLFTGDYKTFSYLLGIGGWSTDMALYKDGTFYGNFHDNDLGDIGIGYPNGTVYICNFSGKFSLIEQKNAYTFKLSLDELEADRADISWIKDETLHITSDPYGLKLGKCFLLYTPDAPLDELPGDLLFWWKLRYSDEDNTNCLNTYALYCEDLSCAFLSSKQW